jgi:hypothetical protein
MRLLWDLWIGTLSLLGNVVLVFVGIGLCAYATLCQLNERHDTLLDSILFALGVLLFASAVVRRLIWIFLGVALVWIPVAGGLIYVTLEDRHRFEPDLTTLGILLIPPFFVTMLLLTMRGAAPRRELESSLPDAGEE